MKLTLESDAVFVRVDDPRFGEARVWKGHDGDHVPVIALVLCVVARREEDEAALRSRLAALTHPAVAIEGDEACWALLESAA